MGRSPEASRRTALLVSGASAYAFYAAAYTSAIRLSFNDTLGNAFLFALANTLPDLAAAPVVLRAGGWAASRRSRALLRFCLLGPVFVAWSSLCGALGTAAIRALVQGRWLLMADARSLAWKALFSLVVFGVLGGVGFARAYAREAREAAARALRAETLRAESRLAVLRAQLNPHFILNVLHSLVGLAERDPRATASALERLGTSLRYALRVQSRGSDRVTLREELAFTREYLELERLRLGERLEVRLDMDDAPLDAVVPPFVLQPLVENAVVHAVAPRARGGVVSIRVAADADALLLRVEDDGSPASPGGEPSGSGAGLGLRLLRDRLDALYQGRAALVLDRSELGGFRASVRLVGEPMAPQEPEGE